VQARRACGVEPKRRLSLAHSARCNGDQYLAGLSWRLISLHRFRRVVLCLTSPSHLPSLPSHIPFHLSLAI
jgi:hypothetical protein